MIKARALLLAAGCGTRLKPLTDSTPKCLVQIGEYRLLEYWVNNLIRAGITEAVINTHYLRKEIQAYIEKINLDHSLQITESYEPVLLGSAGTVTNNKHIAENAKCIVIIYADNLSSIEISEILDFHQSHNQPLTMALFHAEHPRKCGIASLDKNGLVSDFVEKPDNPEGNLANAGIYVLDTDAYERVAVMNAFDFGFDVLPRLIGQIKGYIHEGYHRDIGTLPSLDQARSDVENGLF